MTETKDHIGTVQTSGIEQSLLDPDGAASAAGSQYAPEVVVHELDYRVNQAHRQASSPPFLGLLNFSDEDRIKARRAMIKIGNSDEMIVSSLLKKRSNFASWYLCDTVRRKYGDAGNFKIWPHIANALGLGENINPKFRPVLYNIISKYCKHLALPVPDDGMARLFLLYAGVADSQLQHVIKAFVCQEKKYGLPDIEDGDTLNEWENNSLNFIPHGVKILRDSILWDVSAWHAKVYVKYRNSEKTEGNYFDRFYNIVDDYRLELKRLSYKNILIEKPRLVFDDMDIAIKIPDCSPRLAVEFDNDPDPRFLSDTVLPLSHPIPKVISFGDRHEEIRLMQKPGEALIGDLDTGGNLNHIRKEYRAPMSRAILFSREEILSDSYELENSYEVHNELFMATFTLPKSEPLNLIVGKTPLKVIRQPYCRISIRGGVIGFDISRSKYLHGPSALISICTGVTKSMSRKLKVRLDESDERTVPIITDSVGDFEISIDDLLKKADLSSFLEPTFLYVKLMKPQESEEEDLIDSGVSTKKDIWPGFSERNGVELCCKGLPLNFIHEESQNILSYNRRYPCIDKDAKTSAHIAFRISDKICKYKLPHEGLILTHILPNGSRNNMPIGSIVTLGRKTRGGAVIIRSKNNDDELELPNSQTRIPFSGDRRHTVGFRGLSSGWLRIHSKNLVTQDLIKFLREFEFSFADIKIIGNTVKIQVSVDEPVEAICAKVVSDAGEVEEGAVYFGVEKYMNRPSEWISAELLPNGIISIEIDGDKLTADTWFGKIFVQDDAGLHSIVDSDGGVLTFIISKGIMKGDISGARQHLSRVIDWLDCHQAPISLGEGQVDNILNNQKAKLVKEIDSQPGGRAELLGLSLSDRWYSNYNNWFPTMHTLSECPQMFEGPLEDFWKAGRVFQSLARIGNQRLRKSKELDPFAYTAFSNTSMANSNDEPLSGFDFNKLMINLKSQEEVKLDGWDGLPVLGPAHWVSSHNILQDRIDESEFFTDNRYENRRVNLLRLFNADLRGNKEVLIPSTMEQHLATNHVNFSKCLRLFCIAARAKRTVEWLSGLRSLSGLSMLHKTYVLGDLIRLGLELFAFHLLAAELERRGS